MEGLPEQNDPRGVGDYHDRHAPTHHVGLPHHQQAHDALLILSPNHCQERGAAPDQHSEVRFCITARRRVLAGVILSPYSTMRLF